MIDKTCKACSQPFTTDMGRRVYCDTCRGNIPQKQGKRRGVFVGAYMPAELKRALQQRATKEHRTLSQEVTRILEEATKAQTAGVG